MQSFLTGSRAYGTPRPDSDIDLVVYVTVDDLSKLIELSDKVSEFGHPGGVNYEDGCCLRFGPLNLICVTSQVHFDTWKKGTEELISNKPVTREVAVETLQRHRQEAKIYGW